MSTPHLPESQTQSRIHEECPPALAGQLESFLGEDFNINTLIRDLKSRSLFDESRGVIQSFTPSPDVRESQRAAYRDTHFTAACQPGDEANSEIARYRFEINEEGNGFTNNAKIEISPGALKTVYQPAYDIIDSLNDGKIPHAKLRDMTIGIAYRAVYSNVLAQFMVKQHALSHEGNQPDIDQQVIKDVDEIYEGFFGHDSLDQAVRLDRVSMALGGAVMLRHCIIGMADKVDDGIDHRTIGLPLSLYVAGKRESGPLDHREISFAIAHAFSPKNTATFMTKWFTEQEPPKKPQLKLV